MKWFFYKFSIEYPYYASAIKFLILGTFGEWLGGVIRTKGHMKPFPLKYFPNKILIWAILGIIVKWAFSSFVALIQIQVSKGLLPQIVGTPGTFLFALTVSFEMNLFFSPFFMYFHRFLDNIFEFKWNYKGMHIPIYAIGWFWFPAHTITFLLPENFRIIFAAFLGVCLGVILGFAKKVK